jgi:stage II sporulation protein D
LFRNPTYISCGILLDKRVNSNSIDVKLGYDDKIKWIKVSKKMGLPDGIAYNVKMRGIIVTSITPLRIYTGKVLARNAKTLVLDTNTLTFDKKVYYYKIINHTLIQLSSNSVIVGSSESKFIENTKNIAAVLVSPPNIENIRVGISNSDFSSLNHYSLLMHSLKGLIIKYNDGSSFKIKNDYLKITYKDGFMELSTYTKTNSIISFKSALTSTNKRFHIYSASDNPILVDSLIRVGAGYEYIPKYYGDFELSIRDASMKLINEVNIEDYLRYVVPSEMLSSGGEEGYKVQAVAARTYVLSDMLSGRFAKYGFHVDDTTLSQVYNALPSNVFCDNAIIATAGEVMTYDNKIIDAKYYSTSCGVGAPFNQVWYDGSTPGSTNPEPYLTFNNYSGETVTDLSKDFDASNFLKDWTMVSNDSNSPYYRWKYTVDWKTISTIVNKNIYNCYNKNPDSFKKKWILNFYKPAKIPKSGIGKISDIYISEHGVAGNVLELTIEADTGTYRIYREYNIKRLLISKDIEITPLYGNVITNITSLPSNFFVIDKETSNNKNINITIYGGGFGHGVGMSQYGVIGLVRQGKTYRDILDIFYRNIKFNNYQAAIKSYY